MGQKVASVCGPEGSVCCQGENLGGILQTPAIPSMDEQIPVIPRQVHQHRQTNLVELATLAGLVNRLPDPSAKAWAKIQEAYQMQVAQWDDAIDEYIYVPDAAVRAQLDLAFSSIAPCEPQSIEEAMEVLLMLLDNSVIESALKTALNSAIIAETTSKARAELVKTLHAEAVNPSSKTLPPAAVRILVRECRLGNYDLEARLLKSLGAPRTEPVQIFKL